MASEQDTVLLRNSAVMSMLQNSAERSRSACAVVALTAAAPRSGTTYTAQMLANSLNREHPGSAIYVDGRDLSNVVLLTDGKDVRSVSEETSLSSTGMHRQSWRSSPALRKAYVSKLREQWSYVLIDCPSIFASALCRCSHLRSRGNSVPALCAAAADPIPLYATRRRSVGSAVPVDPRSESDSLGGAGWLHQPERRR